MKYTNILEKLSCVFEMLFSNWVYVSFVGLLAIFLVLSVFKIVSRKKAFLTTFIGYIALLGYTIFMNSKQLGKVGNNLVDNFFTNIYFPSTYTYLFTLIVFDVIVFVTLMKDKVSKAYKWIHGIFFFIMHFVLILILELLANNKIDIFSKTSLFSNKNLVMLLELSMNVFIVWLVSIVFTYLTNLITEKLEGIKVKDNDEVPSDVLEPVYLSSEVVDQDVVSNPVVSEPVPAVSVIEDTNKFIPKVQMNSNVSIETTIDGVNTVNSVTTDTVNNTNVVQTTDNFNLSELIPQKQPYVVPTPMSSDVIFEKILNNDLPVIKEEKHDETDQYTLNDYRLFNKILKEIKEYNHNNTVTIDKNLEYRLITKYSTKTFNMFKGMLKIYSN